MGNIIGDLNSHILHTESAAQAGDWQTVINHLNNLSAALDPIKNNTGRIGELVDNMKNRILIYVENIKTGVLKNPSAFKQQFKTYFIPLKTELVALLQLEQKKALVKTVRKAA